MKMLVLALSALTPLALIGCTGGDKSDTGAAEADADGDGFASAAAGGSDCDDNNPNVYPGAPEDLTDGIDNNCDGLVDVPTTDTETDTTEECGGTPPVVETFIVEPYDYDADDDGDIDAYYIYFGLVVTDDDADLHDYEFNAWFDTVVDGSVDSSGDAQLFYAPSDMGAECGEDYLELNLVTPAVGGGTIEWSTHYEFGVGVIDDGGLLSNVAVGDVVSQDEPGGDTGTTGTDDTGTGADDTGETGETGETDDGTTGDDTGDTGGGATTGDDTGGPTTVPDTGDTGISGTDEPVDTGDTGASNTGLPDDIEG